MKYKCPCSHRWYLKHKKEIKLKREAEDKKLAEYFDKCHELRMKQLYG